MKPHPYIISIDSQAGAARLQEQIGVAGEGIEIMAPLSVARLVRVGGLNARIANVLKQEMLAAGGDAALPVDIYDLDGDAGEAIIIGNPEQLRVLVDKLGRHGSDLAGLAGSLAPVIAAYETGRDRETRLPPALGSHDWLVMGILNVTPDSFHDGGRFADPGAALAQAEAMVAAGAGIIDIGGESTRPGSAGVSEKDELKRVLPVVEAVASLGVPLSIDTSKEPVAREALRLGATMINDVTALRGDGRMAALAAEQGCPVCLMHMQGTPADMQQQPEYADVVGEIIGFFHERVAWAGQQGIERRNIILDPGIGFGKRLEHNLTIINRFDAFLSLGLPVMIGASRKSFLGAVLDRGDTADRLAGTVATTVAAYGKGARVFRVHDVRENVDALKVAAAIGGKG
ncbi:MAG: dihydropteroate synthase [Thermoleophilia bacterium]